MKKLGDKKKDKVEKDLLAMYKERLPVGVSKKKFARRAFELSEHINTLDGAVFGEARNDYTTHEFVNGMYVRTIKAPKGWFAVTMIHKMQSPFFFLKGDVTMFTEEGAKRLKAPMQGINEIGVCRLFYVHEEVEWVAMFPAETEDFRIEEVKIFSDSYTDYYDKPYVALLRDVTRRLEEDTSEELEKEWVELLKEGVRSELNPFYLIQDIMPILPKIPKEVTELIEDLKKDGGKKWIK